MGIAFSSIPGVGPIASWAQLGTFALINTFYTIAAYRCASVPRTRAVGRYFDLDPVNGSAAGGGGNGTTTTPFLVRHKADIKALIASGMLVGNQVLYVPAGVQIPASNSNSDQSVQITVASVNVDTWQAPSSPAGATKGIVTGFVNASVNSFVNVSGNVYDFTTTTARCYWARGKAAGSAYTAYRDQPYTRVNSDAECDSTPYSFYDNGSNRTRVNKGDHDLASIQFAVETGVGIFLGNVDSIGIFDIIVEGSGMNVPGTAGGGQCIRSEAQGTNEHLIWQCEMFWGPYHTGGQFVPGTGNVAGGIVTVVDCSAGLFQWDAANGGDCWVGYNYYGGQECVLIRCRFTHAGLRATGIPTVRGSSCKSHSSASNLVGLYLDLQSDHIPVWGEFQDSYICPDVPTITNRRATSSYRAFVHAPRVRCASVSASASRAAIFNRKLTIRVDRPSGAYAQPHGAGPTATVKGIAFNDVVEINHINSHTGKRTRVYDATAAHDFDSIHSSLRFTGSRPDGIDWQWGAHLQTSCNWNCTTSNETTATDVNMTTASTDHFKEADPAAPGGGLSAPAMFGIPAAQYNSCPGFVTLAAAATFTTGAGAPSNIVNASRALPAGINCEFDHEMRPRNADPTKRTIGPYEARPIGTHQGGTFVGVTVAPTLIGG